MMDIEKNKKRVCWYDVYDHSSNDDKAIMVWLQNTLMIGRASTHQPLSLLETTLSTRKQHRRQGMLLSTYTRQTGTNTTTIHWTACTDKVTGRVGGRCSWRPFACPAVTATHRRSWPGYLIVCLAIPCHALPTKPSEQRSITYHTLWTKIYTFRRTYILRRLFPNSQCISSCHTYDSPIHFNFNFVYFWYTV